MITVEGDAVATQLDKLQEEIGKLRMEKLELLRQNVSCQHELRRLRDRYIIRLFRCAINT